MFNKLLKLVYMLGSRLCAGAFIFWMTENDLFGMLYSGLWCFVFTLCEMD